MNKAEIIAEFENGVLDLKKKIQSIPESLLDYRPSYQDAWTIREHLVHLADSDINNFIRLKSIIGQPGSNVFVIDEDAWTPRISFVRESIPDYMEVFGLLRKIMANFLSLIPVDLFDGPVFYREYKGEKKGFTIKDSLEMYTNHVTIHLEYIDKVIALAKG